MKGIDIDIKKDTVLNPPIDRRSECFKWSLNGKDNQLPAIVEHLINESVTARGCVRRVVNAIIGKGFKDGSTIVHPSGTTLNHIGRQSGTELGKQNNTFIHIGFNAEYKPAKMKVISAKKVRIGRSDDEDYSGKFLVADWSAKRISEDDIEVVDRFNLNENVIKSQVKAAGGIGKYKGQILHLSTDSSYKYAPADVFPVLEDLEFEKLSKKFRRNNSKFGFLNGKVILTGKMTKEEEREFKRDVEKMQGGENAANAMVYQASQAGADLSKMMRIEDFAAKLDDKILSYSDSIAESNICKAFSVPVALVSSKSEGIFGNSGEMLKQMKFQLYEAKEFERMILEEALNTILKAGDFDIKETQIIDPFNTNE